MPELQTYIMSDELHDIFAYDVTFQTGWSGKSHIIAAAKEFRGTPGFKALVEEMSATRLYFFDYYEYIPDSILNRHGILSIEWHDFVEMFDDDLILEEEDV